MKLYVRKYVKIQVNSETYYREKNIIGYYGEFLSEPLEPFEVVEEVRIEVDEMLYLESNTGCKTLKYHPSLYCLFRKIVYR